MDDFLNSVADEIDAATKKNNPTTSAQQQPTSSNIGELLRQASRDESQGYQEDGDYDDTFEEQPDDISITDVKNILKKSAKVVAIEDAIDGKYNLKDAVNAVSESLPTILANSPRNSDGLMSSGYNDGYGEGDDDDLSDPDVSSNKRRVVASASDSESDIDDTPGETDDNDNDGEEENEYPDNLDFIFSCYHHKYDAVEHHLDRGANRFYTDRHNWTALHWACAKGYDDIVHLLLKDLPEKKIKTYIHLKEKTAGMTPLHLACIGGHLDVIRTLIDHKVKKKLKNNLGETSSECVGPSLRTPEGRRIGKLLGTWKGKKEEKN